MSRVRTALIWAAFAICIAVPIVASAASPLLAWRSPVYIAAGFAGVIAMALLLFQPVLAAGYMPGLSGMRGRRVHRWIGGGLVVGVVIHVAALWITSPPDVVDALLFDSPTSFSAWGVIAMWALFAAALVTVLRRRLRMRPTTWRRVHTSLALVVVVTSVMLSVLIEGTMETISKIALCALVLLASAKALADLRVWARRKGSN